MIPLEDNLIHTIALIACSFREDVGEKSRRIHRSDGQTGSREMVVVRGQEAIPTRPPSCLKDSQFRDAPLLCLAALQVPCKFLHFPSAQKPNVRACPKRQLSCRIW